MRAQPETPDKSTKNVLVVGDSLAAEYGIQRGSGWVDLLEQKLQQAYPGSQVRNASISGDTTSGGLTRLPAALEKHAPGIVIIELGSNDALRGLSLDMSRANLKEMIQLAKDSGSQVLLIGMRIPPNYGRTYTEAFYSLFQELAKKHEVGLVPFLLENIATKRNYFQSDGIHPNEEAQPLLANQVWTHLKPLLNPAASK